MSQTYTPSFNPDDQVFDTMADVFQNCESIRSSFSGPTSPSSPVAFQWWGSTSDDKIYLRNYNNTDWIEVFDADTGQITIQPGQITSLMISDSARKGSIVQGENISPANCTLRAKVIGMPISTNTGAAQAPYSTWTTVITSRIYIPATGSFDMYMTARLERARARFVVSGTNSSTTSDVGAGISWTSSEAYLDLSGKSSGWHSLEIQAWGTSSSFTGSFFQMATRAE